MVFPPMTQITTFLAYMPILKVRGATEESNVAVGQSDCHVPTQSGLARTKQERLVMTKRRVSASKDDRVFAQDPSEPRYLKIFTVAELIVASGAG
jgi:hypothetical protein